MNRNNSKLNKQIKIVPLKSLIKIKFSRFKKKTLCLLCLIKHDWSKIIIGLDNGLIQIWNLVIEKCTLNIDTNSGPLITMAKMKNNKLVSGSNYSGKVLIKIWDLVSGNCLYSIIDGNTNMSNVSQICIFNENNIVSLIQENFTKSLLFLLCYSFLFFFPDCPSRKL